MNPVRLPVIFNWRKRLSLFCASAGLGATLGQACGPFFPATRLDQPGDELLRAPRFTFDLSGLLPTHSPWRAGRFGQDTNACQAAYQAGDFDRAKRWLKTLDPKAADRFYKAWVRRCGRTALGRKADQQRWL
jgi:hypothetical protein